MKLLLDSEPAPEAKDERKLIFGLRTRPSKISPPFSFSRGKDSGLSVLEGSFAQGASLSTLHLVFGDPETQRQLKQEFGKLEGPNSVFLSIMDQSRSKSECEMLCATLPSWSCVRDVVNCLQALDREKGISEFVEHLVFRGSLTESDVTLLLPLLDEVCGARVLDALAKGPDMFQLFPKSEKFGLESIELPPVEMARQIALLFHRLNVEITPSHLQISHEWKNDWQSNPAALMMGLIRGLSVWSNVSACGF